jgi:predicted ATPase
VAQIGAVIGRGFSYGLLRDVTGLEDAPLQAALERLAEADILLVQGLPPESDSRFKHALIQDAAYENLLKSRRQVLHRRVAEILRDSFGSAAAAEPEALAYHFTQAGLSDAAIEWWGKAGDQALRRSAFQEAISHLGKAIEMADKAGDGATASATASVGQRMKLQTSYGRALAWSKGYAAEETKAAFARAQELVADINNADERFATYYGLWIGSLVRGELGLAREIAETFLREARNGARATELAVGCHYLGMTCLWQGEFIEAQANLEEALRRYDPERDREAKFRFGIDTGAGAMHYLALTKMLLGDLGPARELIEVSLTRAVQTGHVPTRAAAYHFKALFEALRGDAGATLRASQTLLELSQQYGLTLFLALGALSAGWSRAWLGQRETGVTELQQALAEYAKQENKLFAPFYGGLLAEIEAAEQFGEGALTRIDEALALATEMGARWTDAFLHRIRGEILLKRDPANTTPAEEAFLTAIAIAQQQKAKSFELRAALSLAQLYRSTGRAADAHAVLTLALEDFAPTPEFPEIGQAETLLAALAKTDEVKSTVAARQQRLKLQTSYGQAMLHARGYSAPETRAAFARARELTAGITDPSGRFSVLFGLWANS